jgi:hypothetical protein
MNAYSVQERFFQIQRQKKKNKKQKKTLQYFTEYVNCHAILYRIYNCHVSLTAWNAGGNSHLNMFLPLEGWKKEIVGEVGIGLLHSK